MTAISEAIMAVLGVTTAIATVAALRLLRSRVALARRAETEKQRAETEKLRAETDKRELREEFREELEHLVERRLPAYALHLISSHHPVPGPLRTDGEFAELFEDVLGQFDKTVHADRRRIDSAAWAAVRGTSAEVQALSLKLQTAVDELEHKIDDAHVPDLFVIDHLNEQVLRQVQKSQISSGSWPGHVRPAAQLPNIVTGATSRLHGFERVKVNSHLTATNIGVVARAVEPVAVACTELLANALEHSRSDLLVEVTLVHADNGTVSVVIDDAGRAMPPEVKARGERLVSGKGSRDLLLSSLGNPPAFGLAAIGRLVQDYDFSVNIHEMSPYRGVRAVISIPPHLLTELDEETDPVSAMAPLPEPPPQLAKRHAATAPGVAANDSSGLPQRRRRRRPAHVSPVAATHEVHETPDPEKARGMWSSFQEGLTTGNAAPDTEETP